VDAGPHALRVNTPAGWRAFGTAADLDLDFASDDRPAVVTALLAACAAPRDSAHWWSRSVGERIAAVLRVLVISTGVEMLAMQARCPRPGCGELYEFDLPLGRLIAQPQAAEPVRVRLGGERVISLRRPSGQDLGAWRQWRGAPEGELRARMLASLLIDGDAGVDDAPAIAEALSAVDPLPGFAVDCPCPACGVASAVRIDLEAVALAQFARMQRVLLREVHAFAGRYGWTEAQVFAVPPVRRARYLALIEGER
jgi:hypothetical protein